MKKIYSLIAVLLLFFSVSVLAQETGTSQLIDPGTTPDSFFYNADLAFENIGLALTFSKDAKLEKMLKNAEERLSETRTMALENKVEEMTEAKKKLEETSKDIKEDLGKIEGDSSEEKLRKEIKIEQKIKELDNKVDEVEKEIKIKIKIEGTLTEEQKKIIIELINSFKDKVGELDIEIKENKDKTKIKITEESGQDGDEVEKELKEEEEIENENEIEVEIENGKAKVDLEYANVDEEFVLETTDKEKILNEIALRLSVPVNEIRNVVKFEIEDEELEEKGEDEESKEEDNEEDGP